MVRRASVDSPIQRGILGGDFPSSELLLRFVDTTGLLYASIIQNPQHASSIASTLTPVSTRHRAAIKEKTRPMANASTD